LLRVLTDRGSEYCGNPERHEYELYLAIEDIDHSRTRPKARSNPLSKSWTPLLSSFRSRKVFDGYIALPIHG